MPNTDLADTTQQEIVITDEMIEELKTIILEEEQKVLHLRKHGMNDKIVELIKARIKWDEAKKNYIW